MRVGSSPEELEAMIVSDLAARETLASRPRFRSSFSGALSWMKSASATAFSRSGSKPRRCWLAPGARPTRSSAGQALATLARSLPSAPGAGSVATTSRPWARQRAAQPLPITLVPTILKRCTAVAVCSLIAVVLERSVALSQAEFLPRLCRRQHARAEQGDDLGRPLHQRAVAREHALLEVKVVFEFYLHVAAEQDGLRHHRHLHAADAEARPVRVGGDHVGHALHRRGVGCGSPRDVEADLEERRFLQQPFGQHLVGEAQ